MPNSIAQPAPARDGTAGLAVVARSGAATDSAHREFSGVAGSAPAADASRVVCIFGLPFDAVTLPEAIGRVRTAIRLRQRLFLSTPNLNFLITCQTNAGFRQSVVNSDLSVADGMPLVWLARLLGTPLPERVTGSDLFERLRSEPLPAGEAPIRVYFFGGPPGAAEAASRRLNEESRSMVCVGFESPGFGSVEDMSSEETIERINARNADLLVVALGAVKGQAWIEHNRARLNVPVISHLGAVVNFAAGTVSRAPTWIQRSGLEWLWRIKEEPALWRRYGRDALALVRLGVGRLLPHLVWLRVRRPAAADGAAGFAVHGDSDAVRLHVHGTIPDTMPPTAGASLTACQASPGPVLLDLREVDGFGPSFAAWLLQLERTLAARCRELQVVGLSARARLLMRWNGLDRFVDRCVPAPEARP